MLPPAGGLYVHPSVSMMGVRWGRCSDPCSPSQRPVYVLIDQTWRTRWMLTSKEMSLMSVFGKFEFNVLFLIPVDVEAAPPSLPAAPRGGRSGRYWILSGVSVRLPSRDAR